MAIILRVAFGLGLSSRGPRFGSSRVVNVSSRVSGTSRVPRASSHFSSADGPIRTEHAIDKSDASLACLASSPVRFANSLHLSQREVAEAIEARKEASATLHERLLTFERDSKHTLSASEIGRGKHRMICRHRLEHQRNPFVCQMCWTFRPICVCSLFEGDKAPLPEGIEQVIVWTHHDEWGRTSNTGSLLPLGLQNTTLLMKGLDEHEEVMDQLLDRGDLIPVLLWPGKSKEKNAKTTTIEEIRVQTQIQAKDGTDSNGLGGDPATNKRLLLIAIEGTWNTARKMVNKLPPSVARLDVGSAIAAHLAAPAGALNATRAFGPAPSLLAPLRRRGRGGGAANVSTLEAVVAAAFALGLAEGEARGLLDAARAKVARIGEYTGKSHRRSGRPASH